MATEPIEITAAQNLSRLSLEHVEVDRAPDPVHRFLTRQLAQAPVAVVGLAYAAGFMVMTNLFARWRLPAFDLLRVRYLTAGLYYLVITSAVMLVFFLIYGCVGAAIAMKKGIRAKRDALAAFETTGGVEQLRKGLAIHREVSKPFYSQVYALLTVTALVVFPICILFFTQPPHSQYVLSFFLGMYGGGLIAITVLRLIQVNLSPALSPEEMARRDRPFEVCRWTIVFLMWFFGLDVLAGLRIIEELALVGPFYVIFSVLMGLQLVFLIEPRLRNFGISFVGPTVFWTSLPTCLFIVAYLSMVAFAFQVYPSIPASRGGGAPECVDLEVAESAAGNEVSITGVRKYEWHRGLVLLDDRSDLMYLTRAVQSDGSASELVTFHRPLIRNVRYHPEPRLDVHVFDGWSRIFSVPFWQVISYRLVTLREFDKTCPGP